MTSFSIRLQVCMSDVWLRQQGSFLAARVRVCVSAGEKTKVTAYEHVQCSTQCVCNSAFCRCYSCHCGGVCMWQYQSLAIFALCASLVFTCRQWQYEAVAS